MFECVAVTHILTAEQVPTHYIFPISLTSNFDRGICHWVQAGSVEFSMHTLKYFRRYYCLLLMFTATACWLANLKMILLQINIVMVMVTTIYSHYKIIAADKH